MKTIKSKLIPRSKSGSKIHIKKENRGKFTDWCGGKVTNECIKRGKKSNNPTIRKRATFAANARVWKHQQGGGLSALFSGFRDEVESLDLLKVGTNLLTNLSSNISNTINQLKLKNKLLNKLTKEFNEVRKQFYTNGAVGVPLYKIQDISAIPIKISGDAQHLNAILQKSKSEADLVEKNNGLRSAKNGIKLIKRNF